MKKSKVIVIMPAYNAEKTLEKTIADLPRGYVDEVIVVDDASKDKTFDLAKKLAIKFDIKIVAHRHDFNGGYGANQKTCYRMALLRDADIVVMVHPDYQYDPRLVKYFVEFMDEGHFDVMLGSRIRSRRESLAGGMPLYKYLANRGLTFIENIVSGQNLSEWHTGMRAYTKEVLNSVDFSKFSNDFIFDSQMLFAICRKGFKIGDIPAPVRYFKEASSINWKRSMRYGFLTLWEATKYLFS